MYIQDNVRAVRWYAIFYWVDCLVSIITTTVFAVKWYVYTDHSLPQLADDPVKQQEHDDVFRMEGIVSIIVLVALRMVHVSSKIFYPPDFSIIKENSFFPFFLIDLFRSCSYKLLQINRSSPLFKIGCTSRSRFG